MRSICVITISIATALLNAGCPYSFTGASVPKHLKTIAIPLVDDQSGFGEPGLREEFTTELTNLFLSDNSLEVADKTTADSILEGVITSVSDAPSVVAQGEAVTQRRITMAVKFTYQDKVLRKTVWEKTFSDWGDYDSGGLSEAMKKLTEDILLETVSGW